MLQNVFNILLIVLGFGILIFVHELGHFIAAKWAGIRTEAFAVGMGPVAISWRKGVGLRFGSTAPDYEKRVREHLMKERGIGGDVKQDDAAIGDLPRADFYRIGDSIGLGETEYSLRWLPIGGFVKMLGQEDANPSAVSDDPRSYNMRPIGKRMIVVSAGVIMNLILAVVLFVVAFVIGVRFEAPVVGDISPVLPAGRTAAVNAAEAGVTSVGLQPGDRVLSIDGDAAKTFADLQIASAMSRPGSTLSLVVERSGVDRPLTFLLQPEKDPTTGLLSIGVAPGASTTLSSERDGADIVAQLLERGGLTAAGVKPGMTVVSVNGQEVAAFGQLMQAAHESNGEALRTQWTSIDDDGRRGSMIDATLPVLPEMEEYRQREASGDGGLIGFTPLTRFERAAEGSPNAGIIKPGDVLVKIADVTFPRRSQLFETLQKHRRQDIPIVVLRDGRETPLTCHVNRDGQLRVEISPADDMLITAQPVKNISRYRRDEDEPGKIEDLTTPAGRAGLFATGGTRIVEIDGSTVETWRDMRSALMAATQSAAEANERASVELVVQHPIAGSPRETVTVELTADEVTLLHDLKWVIDLPSYVFEPIYTVRKGSPLQAISMGFEETHKLVMMTYLTIDRLVRGSVGVDQLRGPVGIVHIGAKVADRGFTYLLFFLAMISVNLAVINFLPLPIVDGGLFLFLIYEKFKGRPPSLAFQNAATIVGLVIIGTTFIVTFYNDVLRLIG
jgi:regulator of sigma E protease